MYTVTKEFAFEAAHILAGHTGLCKNLHGHSYRLLVTVTAKNTKSDMVLDFSDLKKIVNDSIISKIDHSFCYFDGSSDEAEVEIAKTLLRLGRRVYPLSARPTAENMCKHFFGILRPVLRGLDKITLFETPTSFCEYSE